MAIALIRTLALYAIIILSLRIMGKRQIGELQPSELVVTILISNIASLPIEDPNVPLITGILPILTLVCFDVFISLITLHSGKIRRIISGKPKIIIHNGIIDQSALKELRFSIDDLMEQMRNKDVFDVNEIDCAIVETTGALSIYKKTEYQETTKKDINISTASPIPFVIISDGCIVKENLSIVKQNEKQINTYLKKNNLNKKEIFLMTATSDGNITTIKKENVNR